MAYSNPIMAELMVPRFQEVDMRIAGFYEDIGWDVRDSSDSEYFTYVNPETSGGIPPTIAYWQTENVGKIALFHYNDNEIPSKYARGLRLDRRHELQEICLVVPTDDDVHSIYERGGKLLKDHTHIPPRDHAGAQEFRFDDPFFYSLRVCKDPGWEIRGSRRSRSVRRFRSLLEGVANHLY